MKLKKIALFFILILFCFNVSAKHIVYTGKVLSNNKGIEKVTVTDGVEIVQTNKEGEFSIEGNEKSKFIYITLPDGYKVPAEGSVPKFYQKVEEGKKEYVFNLQKNKNSDFNHIMIVWADPQVAKQKEIEQLKEVSLDINNYVSKSKENVYALSLGDNVGDHPELYPEYIKKVDMTEIPFFHCVGNHDKDYSAGSHNESNIPYESHFGPTYYSFDRGNIHYIVLNNAFSYGFKYFYMGYIDDTQLEWLKKDLSFISIGKRVIVSMHIPTFNDFESKENDGHPWIKNTLMNNEALYEILKPYKTFIFSGHNHTTENYALKNNIIEHVLPAASGAWWQTKVGIDGTPLGYTVYEIKGDSISWHFKALGRDKDVQFSLYNVGYDTTLENRDYIIANVFNYDVKWRVYWLEDGKRVGEMDRFRGKDPYMREEVNLHKKEFDYWWVGATETNHIFRAKPINSKAKISIEVVDRFGNVYTKPFIEK